MLTFILCFIASIFGIGAIIYWFAIAAITWLRNWSMILFSISIAIIPSAIYALSWRFLPMENWLIFTVITGLISGSIVFYSTVKNGHI